jgi:uncharacterized protein (TIGR02996 family)
LNPLYNCPEVLAFLQDAKEHPEDDTPRLILADWLDEHGDPGRAEFIRLQCRITSALDQPLNPEQRQIAENRTEELLDRYGGEWAGPLWNWRPTDYLWRRGLLAARLNPLVEEPASLEDVLPWIDSMHFEIHGLANLRSAAALLNLGTLNHVGLTFHRVFPETAVLDCLAGVRESSCLRSISFWCVRPAGRQSGKTPPVKAALRPGREFLGRLVRELPLGRHLTHLGIGPRLTPEEASLIRSLNITPIHSDGLDWMRSGGITLLPQPMPAS